MRKPSQAIGRWSSELPRSPVGPPPRDRSRGPTRRAASAMRAGRRSSCGRRSTIVGVPPFVEPVLADSPTQRSELKSKVSRLLTKGKRRRSRARRRTARHHGLPDLDTSGLCLVKTLSFHGTDVLAVSEHGAPGRRPNIHAHFVGRQREDGLDTLPARDAEANRSTLIADIPFPAPGNVAAKRCASEKRAF